MKSVGDCRGRFTLSEQFYSKSSNEGSRRAPLRSGALWRMSSAKATGISPMIMRWTRRSPTKASFGAPIKASRIQPRSWFWKSGRRWKRKCSSAPISLSSLTLIAPLRFMALPFRKMPNTYYLCEKSDCWKFHLVPQIRVQGWYGTPALEHITQFHLFVGRHVDTKPRCRYDLPRWGWTQSTDYAIIAENWLQTSPTQSANGCPFPPENISIQHAQVAQWDGNVVPHDTVCSSGVKCLALLVQRLAKVFVRGCEKFVPALAYLFCPALPGSCLTRFAYFFADLCKFIFICQSK